MLLVLIESGCKFIECYPIVLVYVQPIKRLIGRINIEANLGAELAKFMPAQTPIVVGITFSKQLLEVLDKSRASHYLSRQK